MSSEMYAIEEQKKITETFLKDLRVALIDIREDRFLSSKLDRVDKLIVQLGEIISRVREGRVFSPRNFAQSVLEIIFNVEAIFDGTQKMSASSAEKAEKILLIIRDLKDISPEIFDSELEQDFAKRELETNPVYRLLIKELNSSNRSAKNEYAKLHNSIEKMHSDITRAVTDAKKETEQAEAEAKEILEALKVSAEKAKVTVGLIGATAVSSAHRDRAEEERKIASSLRVGVLISLGISALIILLSIIDYLPPVIDWQDLLLRYGAVVFFTIPAAYMAKESIRHREMQRKYESFHINFAAVNNFFSDMEKEARNQLQTELAKHLLISKESLSDNSNDIGLYENQQKIIELLTKLIDKKISG